MSRICALILILSLPLGKVFSQSTEPPPAHEIYAGIGRYFFLQDLRTFLGNQALGIQAGYKYPLPEASFLSHATVDIEYFDPYVKKIHNQNLLLNFGIDRIFPSKIPLFLKTGFDLTAWSQSKTYLAENRLISILYYGWSFGIGTIFYVTPEHTLQGTLDYHLQEFTFKTSYLGLGVHYVWKL